MRQTVVMLPDKVLRTPTKKVGVFDENLQKLVTDMRETMYASEGIGLAAPQIGRSLKLAVLEYDPKRFNEKESGGPAIPFLTIVNPRVTSSGGEQAVFEEGCLSVPDVHVPVPRATEVNVLAQNLAGERVRIRAKGLLARILQHEIDHLNGILIVDRTTDKKFQKEFQIPASPAGGRNPRQIQMTKISNIKTVFLGTPRFAEIVLEILAESPFRPSWVITEPDKPVGRKQIMTPPPVKTLARRLGIPVAQPVTREELAAALREAQPDLGLIAAYGRILKPEVLEIPRHGYLNIHASLLPKYRGASPIQAAILAGETETGVTIMKIDEGLDTGPILSWAPLPITPDDTTPTLTEKLAELGGTLLVETIPGYLDGAIVPQAQSEDIRQKTKDRIIKETVTKLLTKEEGRLTGRETPAQILRMLRAYTPWPSVWTEVNGARILLLAAHLAQGRLIPDRVQLAGKTPVSWSVFRRDRPELAQKFSRYIDSAASNLIG